MEFWTVQQNRISDCLVEVMKKTLWLTRIILFKTLNKIQWMKREIHEYKLITAVIVDKVVCFLRGGSGQIPMWTLVTGPMSPCLHAELGFTKCLLCYSNRIIWPFESVLDVQHPLAPFTLK